MSGARLLSGWRMALAYGSLLLGLVTLAMTLPAVAFFGLGALVMLILGFGLVAAGLVFLLWLLVRARHQAAQRRPNV